MWNVYRAVVLRGCDCMSVAQVDYNGTGTFVSSVAVATVLRTLWLADLLLW